MAITEIVLKINRDSYITCGDCMFLSVSLHEIRKHEIKDVCCNLFNENLIVNTTSNIEPCYKCNDLPEN